MNWETASFSFEEATTITSESSNKSDIIREENEQKRVHQLKNFQELKGEEDKIIYHQTMSLFGQLLIGNRREEIIKTILSDDCEIFLFNFADIGLPQYGFHHEGFLKLFENKRVIRREVKETYVSLKKATGFQICECEVIDETKGSSMSQFSFEVFSFKGNKVSKIRLSYGSMPMSYDPSSLLIPSKKERMLAKVKELNYSWADQPDLGRIASLMHEDTEYKIWRWKDKKCFTFDKNNFVPEFKKSLEENFNIISIVPYGISSEAQYILGSYVYHLEGKHSLSGQRFIWVSTCIYTFDQDCNIKKMSQQGELYPEGETLIPFQVYSPERLLNPCELPKKESKNGLTIFETEKLNFSFDILVFGSHNSIFTGHIKGLSEFGILEKVVSNRKQTSEMPKSIDIFEDIDDPGYDSIIVIESNKGTITKEDHLFQGKLINFYNVVKFSFENRKLAKMVLFTCEIPEPIPSPYDDSNFTELNFRPKSEYM